MKIFQSGRYSLRRAEITKRRLWNNSMMLHVRSCGMSAQRFIRSQIDANKALIAELEWELEHS